MESHHLRCGSAAHLPTRHIVALPQGHHNPSNLPTLASDTSTDIVLNALKASAHNQHPPAPARSSSAQHSQPAGVMP